MSGEASSGRTRSYALDMFVPGVPRPGGSKKAWVYTPKGGGKPRAAMQDASGANGKNWRSAIVGVLASAWKWPPLDCPLAVDFEFTMPRPKAHYRPNGELRPNAPVFHTGKPDTTKLVRAAEDSINGIAWVDDSRIVIQNATKVYGDRPGMAVRVQAL